jgi:ribosomal protein L11 methyltransferase
MTSTTGKAPTTTNHPAKTYELRIAFHAGKVTVLEAKQRTISFLKSLGCDSFVEGAIDGLDIDNEFTHEPRDFYTELGGLELPISVYKYSREYLEDLQARIAHHFDSKFPGQVTSSMHDMDTSVWLEGWKESFKPLVTERFAIYPPWDKPVTDITRGRLLLEIEPGIAFGTGQHATTQLCLREIERIAADMGTHKVTGTSVLDVGTGTGILALGCYKLGFGRVAGTDIDPDAVLAARNNAAMNGVILDVAQMTVPSPAAAANLNPAFKPPFDIVVANILKVVLEKILPDLAGAVAPGGLLVMSGLLHEDARALTRQAESLGLKFERETMQDDWACLVLQKPI